MKSPSDRSSGSNGKSREWARDFQAFAEVPEASPPAELGRNLRSTVGALLNPSPWRVFSKLSGVHALVGMVSLSICPQLGVGTGEGMHGGLAGVFMAIGGHYGCQVACGGLFLGATVLVVSLVFRPEELRVLRRFVSWQLAGLSGLSFAALVCAGAEVVLSLSLFWFLGAIVGGFLTFELGWRIRFSPASR